MYQEKKTKSDDEILLEIKELKKSFDSCWFAINENYNLTAVARNNILFEEDVMPSFAVLLFLRKTSDDSLVDFAIVKYDDNEAIKNAINQLKGYAK